MKRLLLVCTIGLCTHVYAEDDEKLLHTEAEFGFINTSGNTDATSLNGKLNIKTDLENWIHTFVLEGFFKEDQVTNDSGETETQTTAEKYFTSFQSDYKIDKENASFFAFGSYTEDKFSGFDFQSTLAIGYSDAIFKNDSSHLTYNIGPGYTVNRIEAVDPVTMEEFGDTTETVVVHVTAEYLYRFSENAKFTQTITSDISTDSDENTKTKAVSAITSQLNGSLALKVSYTLENNSQVAEGKRETDTKTAVTLVLTF